MRASRLLFVLLLGCSDYNLNGEKDPEGDPEDTGTPTGGDGATDGGDTTPEECNGQDDDGDGDVDEGFPDTDGDGDADCIDQECTPEAPLARSETDSTCEGGAVLGDPPVNPWNVAVEWHWSAGYVYSTPVAGDLDGDGDVEVVVNQGTSGYFSGGLVVLNGSTGAVELSIPGTDPTGGVALGDIDNDGYADIVTYGEGGSSIRAYTHTGALMWQYAVSTNLENYAVITDLDGDGDVEVIGNQYILDGATGSLIASLSGASGNWGAPAVADLDLDGFQEIMLENRVYNYDGSFRFACGAGGVGTFPHPVNIDADNLGEVMIAAPSRVTVCDDDGSTLWSRAHTSYGTATAIADFDNDGMQEFAFANYGSLTLLEGDGSTRWSTSVSDYSGLAGTTSWDIDLDGVPEVIYADENDILVLNGATGAVVARNPSHGSVTLAETPAVADVDGDGQGELIYGSNDGSYRGITVFGGADGDWPYSRPVYNQATYYGANINDDLSVPANPDPPWIHPANIFRGQPSAIYVAARPNLRAEISDVCIASCEAGGQAMVWLQVWNDGAGDVAPGAVLDLYGNPGGSRTLVASTTLTDPVPAQGSVEVLIETTHELLGDGLEAVVDGAEVIVECHEDDNTDTMAIEPCNP